MSAMRRGRGRAMWSVRVCLWRFFSCSLIHCRPFFFLFLLLSFALPPPSPRLSCGLPALGLSPARRVGGCAGYGGGLLRLRAVGGLAACVPPVCAFVSVVCLVGVLGRGGRVMLYI